MKTIIENAKTISRKRYGYLDYDFTEGYIIGASDIIKKACEWLDDVFPDCYVGDEDIKDVFRKYMNE